MKKRPPWLILTREICSMDRSSKNCPDERSANDGFEAQSSTACSFPSSVVATRCFENSSRGTTLDGKEHGGRRLRLESDHVRSFIGTILGKIYPSSKSHESKSARRTLFSSRRRSEDPCEMRSFAHPWTSGHSPAPCMIVMTTLFSPAWIYTAVTAPSTLLRMAWRSDPAESLRDRPLG